jgi:hypothetical protein
MKIFIILLLALAPLSFETKPPKQESTQKIEQTVYICKGPESKRFHAYSGCRGLSNCSTQIFSVSQTEAERIGRTACQICY